MATDNKKQVVSPLHKVVDADRWDAEGLLGRLIIFIHAAFLDAGFVPLPLPLPQGRRNKRFPVLREAGRTAAALSLLQYTAPQLFRRQEDAERARGGMDATSRALRRDAKLAALWRRISNDLCRLALVDLCHLNGVVLEPSFMSLPCDVEAAILARLADGKDLERVECTCVAWSPSATASSGSPSTMAFRTRPSSSATRRR
ncbi:hypothetical protein PR202_gb00965 [Eleusine coracana subsp. coracana]|uniref:F-box domain-containing protein n=1 Tax=Eleusine coracana subsp. coracana TaxID=191504 RepID=A0AAV5DV18_ELECO|nr:hypothetical protein PR202_gb00965 [Eleusine coracana subsp. coracana]